MTTERVTELHIDGLHMTTAQVRLDHVLRLISDRNSALDLQAGELGAQPWTVRHSGPAFVAHMLNVPRLLDDDVCTAVLLHIARNGKRTGVVAKLYGDAATVIDACSRRASALAAALIEGRVLQLVDQPEPPERIEQARTMAAAIRRGDAAEAGEMLAAFVRQGAEGDTAAVVGAALRRAADTLDPRGADIRCPLCLASPVLLPGEVEYHLVAKHAVMAEGAQ